MANMSREEKKGEIEELMSTGFSFDPIGTALDQAYQYGLKEGYEKCESNYEDALSTR